MWSRAFPGVVLLAAAGAVITGYGDASSSEIRLIAAGVAVILLAAGATALRRREDDLDHDIAPPILVPAPPILPRVPTPVPVPAQVRPPSRGTNYQIITPLASGGMGAVFLAWQHGPRNFRRQVVLKRLHARFTADARATDMFLHEAQVAAGFSHPNIVPIHELYQDDDGSFVMVMEYVYGPTLLAVLRAHHRRGAALPNGAIVRIGSAICDALHHAYASPGPDGLPHRIIHRDVSPSNVMIRYDGEVKLLDFGLAMVGGERMGDDATVTGKLGYMSPEQLCAEVLDHQTDVFSLGVVLWEMATGKRLFRREHDAQMVHAILRAPIQGPRAVNPSLDPGLDDIILRALARDRRVRYPDAASIARDLRGLADDRGWSRKRADLIALIEGVDGTTVRAGTETVPHVGHEIHEIPVIIESEASRATEVIDEQDLEFTADRSPLTVEHTAILAGRIQRAARMDTPV
jgi:serine/threonine protein kinase